MGVLFLWFSKEVKDGKCHMIESSYANILSGRKNFKKASKQGNSSMLSLTTIQIYQKGEKLRSPLISMQDNSIQSLAILHADIQGAELNMLRGPWSCSKKVASILSLFQHIQSTSCFL